MLQEAGIRQLWETTLSLPTPKSANSPWANLRAYLLVHYPICLLPLQPLQIRRGFLSTWNIIPTIYQKSQYVPSTSTAANLHLKKYWTYSKLPLPTPALQISKTPWQKQSSTKPQEKKRANIIRGSYLNARELPQIFSNRYKLAFGPCLRFEKKIDFCFIFISFLHNFRSKFVWNLQLKVSIHAKKTRGVKKSELGP